MASHKAALASEPRPVSPAPFTVERANRALVLVRRIVADIVARYHELIELRARHEQLGEANAADPRLDAVVGRIEHCVDSLERLHRELMEVGCVLRDWRTGLIDFPAEREGRRVWLCWRLGEQEVGHWHELQDGVVGRRPVDEAFV